MTATIARRRLLHGAAFATCRALLPGPASAAPMPDAGPDAGPDAAVPPDGVLRFDIFRHDSRIGTHDLRFTRAGDALLVAIDIAIRVGFGPITLYRYRMQATERWQGGRFAGLDAGGDDDGKTFTMHAATGEDGGVSITATDTRAYVAPPGALPLTHWNMRVLQGRFFNPQTGRMMDETVRDAGDLALPMPGPGLPAAARCYRLTGHTVLADWYADGIWTALSAQARDGSTVSYRRT